MAINLLEFVWKFFFFFKLLLDFMCSVCQEILKLLNGNKKNLCSDFVVGIIKREYNVTGYGRNYCAFYN